MSILGNAKVGQFAAQDALGDKLEAVSRAGSADALQRQKAAQEFASFLYLEVLKAMRTALPRESLFQGESLARDIYTSMMDAEIAQLMARRNAGGLPAMVDKSLVKDAPASRIFGEGGAPVEGVVSSRFGARADPMNGARKFHDGVDIAAPAGTSIKAAVAGKVTFSGQAAGYGNMVEVDHGNGVITRYGHNAVNLVSQGQSIAPGQAIALVGSTGHSTGAHLHFEVRRAGKPVDPEMLLGGLGKGSKLKSVA